MIYRAIQLIQIFLADGRTNEGVSRGPRGPKKHIVKQLNIPVEAVGPDLLNEIIKHLCEP